MDATSNSLGLTKGRMTPTGVQLRSYQAGAIPVRGRDLSAAEALVRRTARSEADAMARLLSVNVGLPRDIAWRGMTVRTGVWKDPAPGRCRVGRLNLDGDGQGDLAGHGGEHRAVFVYQIESYRYWQEQLGRTDFVYGQFGENFTVEGLPDDSVCIGDRYRIGSALFEVTQPRVTCYRVGIRMNEPRMPALLTSSGRPGFYFRVLKEGEVGAGDEIVKVEEGEGADVGRRGQRPALFASPSARSSGTGLADCSALARLAVVFHRLAPESVGRQCRTRASIGCAPGRARIPVAEGDGDRPGIGRCRVDDDAAPRWRAAAGSAARPVRRAAPSTRASAARRSFAATRFRDPSRRIATGSA